MNKTRWGRCIYESASGYQVYQNWLYRWLKFNSTAIQTLQYRRNPWKPGLHYLPMLTLTMRYFPGDGTLLGLGGGGIPWLLSKAAPQKNITAIEISAEVIKIAQTYFGTSELKNLTVIEANAADFVQEHPEQCSHILVDLYNAHHFPPECCTEVFFQNCSRLISSRGVLTVNLANISEQKPILELIKNYCRQVLLIPIKRSVNLVLIAGNFANHELFYNQLLQTKEIKKISWVQDWGFVGSY
ncbi:MAG: methyltransferase domain-containing protein [Legionella sp.]|nr:methyltransferase domain-containing protein [Legionella sp.]